MNRFVDLDPIEEYLGKSVVEMTEWELISYLKDAMRALYDIDLAVEGYAERSILVCLRKTYGTDTGRIVKWVIWQHHGRPDGQYVTFTSFSKGRRWFTDRMHLEMQDQVARESAPAQKPVGMVSALKLL